MRYLLPATLLLWTTTACGTGDDGGDDDFVDTTPTTTCFDVTGSCGQTIGGALCTSSNGGSCIGGTLCSAQGTRAPPPCSPLDAGSCSGETVCIDESCVDAFPRFYTLTVRDVSVGQRDSNGDCWDVGCGAPDPFVLVVVNGETVGVTATRDDVFSATFDESFDFELAAGSEISVGLFDEDVSEHDLVLGCFLGPLDGAEVRERDFICRGDNSVSFSLVPR